MYKVFSNVINGDKMYIAGRIKDESKPLHSGNVEYVGNYENDRDIAQQKADEMNGVKVNRAKMNAAAKEFEKELNQNADKINKILEDADTGNAQEYQKWIAIVEDGNGKIHIFTKYTDDPEAFNYEVSNWKAGATIATYREADILQKVSL